MSTPKIKPEELTVEKLSIETDLSSFCCSNEDETGVDEFIHDEALKYQEEKMGTTYLFYYGEILVGFATISMNSIKIDESPDEEKLEWIGLKRIPVVYIGQLGTDNSYRKRDIGKIICDWCTAKAEELSEEIACRYIVLHTYSSKIDFYTKCNFETTDPTKKDILMVRKIF